MSTARRPELPACELRREGWIALTERLGVSGAMRFLQQYDPGHGDDSVERHRLLGDLTLDDAISEMGEGPARSR